MPESCAAIHVRLEPSGRGRTATLLDVADELVRPDPRRRTRLFDDNDPSARPRYPVRRQNADPLGVITAVSVWALLSVCAVLGLLVGSFLNVVVYRLPAGLSVSAPRRSFCPACGNPVRPRDNVPVLSWLLLRGRCRDCQTPISAHYLVVEAATGAMFAALGWCAHERGWGMLLLAATLWTAAAGIALAVIDARTMRLPDRLVLPLYPFLAGVLSLDALTTGDHHFVRAAASLALWVGLFAVLHYGSGGRAMGLGDVKLAAPLGVLLGWLGWPCSVFGLVAGFWVGGYVALMKLVGRRAQMRARVPYGPWLLSGALLGVLAGPAVWHCYSNLLLGW